MRNQAEAIADQPLYGRPAEEAAGRVGMSKHTIIRLARIGYKLSDGVRIYPRATVFPGGYRFRDEDVDSFLATITADRLNRSGPAPRSIAERNRSSEEAVRKLASSSI